MNVIHLVLMYSNSINSHYANLHNYQRIEEINLVPGHYTNQKNLLKHKFQKYQIL